MKKDLHELKLTRELTDNSDELVSWFELERIKVKEHSFPILGFCIGSQEKSAPTLGLFGGVHGLEKVGSHVVITYLSSLFSQLKWDKQLRKTLETCRIVSIPVINPGGMFLNWRSNPQGVDLMRNAPIECENIKPTFLVSGHRLSKHIPWYRGEEGTMELESQALSEFVKKYMFESSASISLDFHSGFGLQDRLWYPYAKTSVDFPRVKEVQRLNHILDQTMPHHVYKVEPQYASYTISGDMWDYLFDEHQRINQGNNNVFIPWTLEMGSWIWVKKNPLQLFSATGMFNPVKSHRYDRTMRRHLLLIDFFLRVIRNKESWT